MRRALLLPCFLATAGCDMLDFLQPAPPAIPYATVGAYSHGCGYEWNGAGVSLEGVASLARDWNRGREAALLFRFEGAPPDCVEKARRAVLGAGFARVWIVPAPAPRNGDPPLVPPAR